MTTLRIGLAQVRQTADFEANAAVVLRFIDVAAETSSNNGSCQGQHARYAFKESAK